MGGISLGMILAGEVVKGEHDGRLVRYQLGKDFPVPEQ
jgi:hypothetical protein